MFLACDSLDANLAMANAPSALKLFCCNMSGWTTSIHSYPAYSAQGILVGHRSDISDISSVFCLYCYSLHSSPASLYFYSFPQIYEAKLLICQSSLHTQWNPPENKLVHKRTSMLSRIHTATATQFPPSFYCFCCSPNGAECRAGRVWNNFPLQRKTGTSLIYLFFYLLFYLFSYFFLFSCDCFWGLVTNHKPTFSLWNQLLSTVYYCFLYVTNKSWGPT